ncbi:hypothetical protein CB0940_10720 [Cercospora beticola]|uniref:Cullin N-terminal domain-containing protein n=1 Tax=Cercospora beticola TaxID=122368 RepID=A0A2G5HVF4_CERBT|nr:hypothetical protein CB0940_10720 [Cercospora beticola]PIA96263.1 hypothetical protein CB0940_10720 [Cercospora beticola]WPB07447.1 hypothetical protein RHO25_012108 [Cercospora beticola]
MSQDDGPASFQQPPKPPSRKETRENPAPTLAWIEDRIAEIYSVRQVHQQHVNIAQYTLSTYMDTYTAIHEFCTFTKHGRTESGELNGESLYRRLESAIKAYCQEVAAVLSASQGGESIDRPGVPVAVLSAYSRQRNTFSQICKKVEHMFSFLDRHWIKREVDENKHEVYELRRLHDLIWVKEVLGVTWPYQGTPVPHTTTLVVESMKELQQRGENDTASTGSEDGLVQSVLDTFRSLGLEFVDGDLTVPKVVETVVETPVEKAIKRAKSKLKPVSEEEPARDGTQN